MVQRTTSRNQNTDFAGLMIAITCGLAIAATALFLGVIPFERSLSGSRDFVVYWATGYQLLHHLNPYDPRMMGLIEHAAGFTGHGSYYMRNPPWTLPLALPLGFLPARVAALPWSLLMLGVLILCVRMLWQMFGRPGTHLEWLGYCFPPALLCVVAGQTVILLLLGLVLFLRLHRTHPFRAGAALWFCTLKPHLFLPWAAVLLAWIVVTRGYRILLGAAAALGASCVLTEMLDPGAWSQYLQWARHSGIGQQFLPCLSVLLRNLINPAWEWLVFVLPAIGCVWALVYFWPRRHSWDWLEHGNLVLLVSLLVAPYCWLWDNSIALPALLYGACRTQSRGALAILAILFLVLQVEPYALMIGLESKLFLWPAVAWLVWYVAATRSVGTTQPALTPEAAKAGAPN